MKRPETTSQNHQYAIRRVLIVPPFMLGVAPAASLIAPKPATQCDMLHIWPNSRGSRYLRKFEPERPATLCIDK
jgi:hypothetical protein